jgi:ATP-dependent RNA helicase DeaD
MIPALTEALSEKGYETLTPVQEAVTNPELADKDLLVSAQTGSGKTVGFGLAIGRTLLGDADTFDTAGAPLALVVAPTRELAMQVKRELAWLYGKTGVQMASCVGGMDVRDERRALDRGAHIVVGTPGRLRDHIQRGALDLSQIRAVVLDEADEMLDMGFREDLEFMLAEAPAERRTLLFSATVPPMIATLAKHYQRDAVRVNTATGARQHSDIAYQAVQVSEIDVEPAILNLLRYHQDGNTIVFANTRATVNRLMARLGNRGFSVVCLSGELSQTERTHALQAMRDGRAQVCVATDVAARGIDLPGLDLVIHADLPMNAEALLHRSGRTGRAGRKGVSVLIVPSRQVNKAERLLKFGKINAEWVAAPTADDVRRRDEERLLADAAWSDAPNEEEAAFAARLAALHSPETLAVACLRLFNARLSAPEDLGKPAAPRAPRGDRPEREDRPERPERTERAPFGPSTWVSLSVGRSEGAEPRWLLPMLCRVGGLSKEQIGAIRMQQDETHVELTADAVDGFIARLGEGSVLEGEITVSVMDAAPPATPRPPRDDSPRPARDFDGPRGPARPKRDFDSPRPARPARDFDGPRPPALHATGTPRAPHGPATTARVRRAALTPPDRRATLTARAQPATVTIAPRANRAPRTGRPSAPPPVSTHRAGPSAMRPRARRSRAMTMTPPRAPKALGANLRPKATVPVAPRHGWKKRRAATGHPTRPSGSSGPASPCPRRAESPLANPLASPTARAALPPKGASPGATPRRASLLASAPDPRTRARR